MSENRKRRREWERELRKIAPRSWDRPSGRGQITGEQLIRAVMALAEYEPDKVEKRLEGLIRAFGGTHEQQVRAERLLDVFLREADARNAGERPPRRGESE